MCHGLRHMAYIRMEIYLLFSVFIHHPYSISLRQLRFILSIYLFAYGSQFIRFAWLGEVIFDLNGVLGPSLACYEREGPNPNQQSTTAGAENVRLFLLRLRGHWGCLMVKEQQMGRMVVTIRFATFFHKRWMCTDLRKELGSF